jgi:hypothetical protein
LFKAEGEPLFTFADTSPTSNAGLGGIECDCGHSSATEILANPVTPQR